jgi:hypothetical protein
MLYKLAADFVVLIHFSFIIFVVLGGLLVLRWPKVAIAHLPAVAWGAWIEFAYATCPLTPLEKYFRAKAGRESYEGGFINNYIIPLIYPSGYTEQTADLLGYLVMAINLVIYSVVIYRWIHRGERGKGQS